MSFNHHLGRVAVNCELTDVITERAFSALLTHNTDVFSNNI